jgi:hypothetical protein
MHSKIKTIRTSLPELFSLTFVFVSCLVFAGIVSAWTGPTAAAPANNINPPINTSVSSQVKSGGLGVASLISTGEVAGTLQGGYGQFRMVAGNYGSFWRQDGATTYLLITASGDQYGSWNSLRPLSVDDATGNVSIGTQLAVTNSVQAVSFLYTSDQSLKHNINTITDALGSVDKLRGVTFNWNKTGKADVGVIAQEVEKVLPQLVSTDPSTGLKSVEYGNLTGVLIEAVKEQQQEIIDMKARQASLESRIVALEATH